MSIFIVVPCNSNDLIPPLCFSFFTNTVWFSIYLICLDKYYWGDVLFPYAMTLSGIGLFLSIICLHIWDKSFENIEIIKENLAIAFVCFIFFLPCALAVMCLRCRDKIFKKHVLNCVKYDWNKSVSFMNTFSHSSTGAIVLSAIIWIVVLACMTICANDGEPVLSNDVDLLLWVLLLSLSFFNAFRFWSHHDDGVSHYHQIMYLISQLCIINLWVVWYYTHFFGLCVLVVLIFVTMCWVFSVCYRYFKK